MTSAIPSQRAVRLGRRVAVLAATVATVAVGASHPGSSNTAAGAAGGSAWLAGQAATALAALQAQAAAIQQQLTTVEAQQGGNAAATAALAQQQAQLATEVAAAQQQLATANAKLASTQVEIRQTQATLDHNKKLLSSIVAAWYEVESGNGAIGAVVNSGSFQAAVSTYSSLQQLSDAMRNLTFETQDEMARLQQLRGDQAAAQRTAFDAVAALVSLQGKQAGTQRAYQQQAAALTGQAKALAAQLQALQAKIAAALAAQAAAAAAAAAGVPGSAGIVESGALAPFALGPRPDLFPWGQCTWYVASLRTVTWNGNADEWAANAKAQGMPEGMQPRPGAIVVWGAGNGYSSVGHVAYVVSVQGPTSFTIDEANNLGLGVVDQRTVPDLHDVLTFIY